MAIRTYNATIRNLSYRLRAFKDGIPDMLEDIVRSVEDVIISAVANDQLYRRGINGKGEKIMDYAPYAQSTIRKKIRKGQPHTRVTLRDTKAFHDSMYVEYDSDGFRITASDYKTEFLVSKYRPTIFRLTDKNFTRIVRSHIRKEFVRRLKKAISK